MKLHKKKNRILRAPLKHPNRIALLFHTKEWDSYYKIRTDGHASAWIERLEAIDKSNPRTAACNWSCSFLVKCSWSASQRSWESFLQSPPSPKALPEGWLTWPAFFPFFVQCTTIFICRMGMVGGADEYFLLPIRVSPWSCLSAIGVAWALWHAIWATAPTLSNAQYIWRTRGLQVFVW